MTPETKNRPQAIGDAKDRTDNLHRLPRRGLARDRSRAAAPAQPPARTPPLAVLRIQRPLVPLSPAAVVLARLRTPAGQAAPIN